MAFVPADVPAAGQVNRRAVGLGITAVLIAAAAVGWWWSVRMTGDMNSTVMPNDDMGATSMGQHSITFAAFLLAWVAMMAAMMFPAISPVVRLYALAAARGRVAPLPFFVVAYLVVWTALGVPAFFAWQALDDPLSTGAEWAGRLAAVALLTAAAWQVTPLKSVCLRHCRSPLSFFMEHSGRGNRRLGAFRMGAAHGWFCVGCCWALMAVLVAMGTMNLAWMAALAVLIFLEKNVGWGERVATAGAAVFAVLGVLLLFQPQMISSLT